MRLFAVRIKLVGLNFLKVYKKLRENGIVMTRIFRDHYNTVFFTISSFQYKKMESLIDKTCYQVTVEKRFALAKIFYFLSLRFGAIIGCLFFAVFSVFSSFFVWNIQIYGLDRIEESEVRQVLKENGVTSGLFLTQIDGNALEDALLKELPEISLVSVMKNGSTIIVNVKEKLYVEQLDTTKNNEITAPYSGQIVSMHVVQGTAKFNVGDIVKIGETVVAGYYYDLSGQKVACKANAVITLKIWFFQTELYYKKLTIAERTGRKITQYRYKLFGSEILINNPSQTYQKYDTIVSERYLFLNNILPLKLLMTSYYETVEVVKTQDFNADKEEVLSRVKKLAKAKVPTDITLSKEFEVVEEMEDYFIVSAYCEAVIQI